ncbi:MAG: SDR family NAD(P)-dependent oxidoreductase, partial [Deltaproteobacteria bacterium]|nr:SDR family NAD(P)-dependent oxidoreductase [Deltaproteobacteria bacterium]
MPRSEVFLAGRDFNGRGVVITGGAGGIGRALARSFGGAGAKIAIVDLPSSPLGMAREELASAGIEALALPCDITDREQVRDAMATIREAFGSIDVLINNAGIAHRSAFADTQPEVFRRVMEVNLFGALHCTQACMDDLVANRGLIIAVSSIAGLAPLYGRSGYAASKHAMHGLFGRCADGLPFIRRLGNRSIGTWCGRQTHRPATLKNRTTRCSRRRGRRSIEGGAVRTQAPRAHSAWQNQRAPIEP